MSDWLIFVLMIGVLILGLGLMMASDPHWTPPPQK